MDYQTLDVKIGKFKDFVEEFHKMFEQGHLSVNMYKSEQTRLRMVSEELQEKNKQAEEQLSNIVSATDKIKADADEFVERKKADALVLYSKAFAKYKEFERNLEEADKKRLKNELKELEKGLVTV